MTLKFNQKRILIGAAAVIGVCVAMYVVFIGRLASGPDADFLIPELEGLRLGMSREDLVRLRGDAISSDDDASMARGSSAHFEVVDREDQHRSIVYLVTGEPPVLQSFFYGDTYPTELLDERIEQKVRSAADRWGRPFSIFAEMQQPNSEFFGAAWRISPGITMTISYVPQEARKKVSLREYPVITRFIRGEEKAVQEIEPESFDFARERAAFEERLEQWGVR